MTTSAKKLFTQTPIDGETVSIAIGHALDNSNANEMAELLSSLQHRFRYIHLDMRDLEFLSSAGVGSILGALEISRSKGGDIVLCNLSQKIIHVITILDLHDYLTIRTTSAD